jgi:ribosomal RNA assembly protein
MIKIIKIPEARMPVLIGTNGNEKRRIERRCKVKIRIEDVVEIKGEALDVMVAENVVKAIGRGFPPIDALKLTDENNTLIVIQLPKDDKKLKRLRSRLIGSRGKCRRNIEKLAGVEMSVYGRTVSLIGGYENVERAREAVEKIIAGAPHSNAYRMLEK